MKEEELIKTLESVELPEIELQSHQRRLRMALLNSGYSRRQWGVPILELAKSKLKGVRDTMIRELVSRQPVWKTALASALAVVLIMGLAITLPGLTGQSPEALAADIAQNSPEVRALVGGEPVALNTTVTDGTAYVLCLGRSGESAISIVDVVNKTELQVVEVKSELPQLSDEQKAKAIDIVKANSKAQELLSSGGTIAKVVGFPMPVKIIKVGDDELTLKEDETGSVIAGVIIVAPYKEDDEAQWVFQVDLAKEKVVDIIEPVPEKPVLEKPEPVWWTAPSGEELIDIAKTDPEVQELFDQGAVLVGVGTAETDDGVTADAALALQLDEELWMVRIDLVNEQVTEVKLLPQVELGDDIRFFDDISFVK